MIGNIARMVGRPAGRARAAKHVIFNADDFGASTGVNRGILECYARGVVRSTSLVVTGRAVDEAVSMSADHPALDVGFRCDIRDELGASEPQPVREEFHRQLDAFQRLLGRMPTHVDFDREARRGKRLLGLLRELVEPLGVPLRGDGRVRFIGSFYAEWEWKPAGLDYVHAPSLEELLCEDIGEGWTELSCRPGYLSPDFASAFLEEREAEVRTLTDPRIRRTIEEEGIRLASYADYLAAAH